MCIVFQLADETSEVQYATQTVTVTERDAKALGQPVGSTTTVLLTAYPGGHSGASSSSTGPAAALGEPINPGTSDASSQQFFNTQPSSAGNVQVVYSASHIDSMSSGVTNPDLTDYTTSTSSQVPGDGTISSLARTQQPDGNAVSAMGVSDYLNPAAGREVMMPHNDSNVGGASEVDTAGDLAAELIREYSLGAEGLGRKADQLTPISRTAGEGKDTKSPES